MNRVNGNLALSRAFGDFFLKQHSNSNIFNRQYNQLHQPVIALPTVTIVEREQKNDQYLLLACDGIFDVFRTEQLIDYTTNRFAVLGDPKLIANELIDTTFARGAIICCIFVLI